jgi:elongation factor G
MSMALSTMAIEDPSFRVSVDHESGETILKGMGELHLDIKVDILRRTYGVDANVGAPQVAYRETLVRPADIDYTHKKQTGGTGQFARVKLRLEPNETGKGNEFESEIVGGTVPKEYIPGVEKGVKSVWDSGVLIGFPVVDTKVTLYDGAFHEVDSSAIAFEIAARSAMKEGCDKAGVKLLEPVMDVEVVTPGDFVGSVIGDINSRRGQIRNQEMRGNATVIRAYVPLANMFGYVSQLRSMSQGRASYTMQFAHYADVPRNVADEVKAKYA